MIEKNYALSVIKMLEGEIKDAGLNRGHLDYFAPSREICLPNADEVLEKIESMSLLEYTSSYPHDKIPVNAFHMGWLNFHGELLTDGSLRTYHHIFVPTPDGLTTTRKLVLVDFLPPMKQIDWELVGYQGLKFLNQVRHFRRTFDQLMPEEGFPSNIDLVTERGTQPTISLVARIRPVVERRSSCPRFGHL